MFPYKCVQGSLSCFYTKQSYGWPCDSCGIWNHAVNLVATGYFGFMKQLILFRIIPKVSYLYKIKKSTSF
jgi:hypothetical protein